MGGKNILIIEPAKNLIFDIKYKKLFLQGLFQRRDEPWARDTLHRGIRLSVHDTLRI